MAFDPYHKWLGIPPAEQPPHYYRLLGIAAFESDHDVIDVAANQKMAYLQDMAAGANGTASQKLLNEISTARRCLLNADKKKQYDDGLRRKLQAAAPKEAPVPTAAFVPPSGSFAKPAVGAVEEPKTSPTPEVSAPKSRKIWWIGGGVLGIGLTLGLALMASSWFAEPNPKTAANTPQDIGKKSVVPPVKPPPPIEKPPTKPVTPVEKPPVKPVVKPPAPPVVEKFPRPMYHFAPKAGVMSDLCDVLYFGNRYHLYYLWHSAKEPAKKRWGYAVSGDALRWEEQKAGPFAEVGDFSPGAMVLDLTHAAGLGRKTQFAILAFHCSNDPKGTSPLKSIYSQDLGRTWKPWEVKGLPAKLPGPGRPRVVFHKASEQWILVWSAGDENKMQAKIFGSKNLADWKHLFDFDIPDGSPCAELVDVPVHESKPPAWKWCVLTDAGHYHIAEFDAKSLGFSKNLGGLQEKSRFATMPRVAKISDGRRTLVGLLRSGSPGEGPLPVQTSLAQELRLHTAGKSGYYFQRLPVRDLAALRGDNQTLQNIELNPGSNALGPVAPQDTFELVLNTINTDADPSFELTVRGVPIVVRTKEKEETLKVGSFAPVPIRVNDGKFNLQIYSDHQSLELSMGSTSTFRFVPTDETPGKGNPVRLVGQGVKLVTFSLTELRLPEKK